MILADVTITDGMVTLICTLIAALAAVLTRFWIALVREYRARNAFLADEVDRLVRLLIAHGIRPDDGSPLERWRVRRDPPEPGPGPMS